MTDVWSLSTMSFKGTVPGAVHAYGVLSGPHGRNYKVCEKLDKEAAAELNAHAKSVGRDYLEYDDDMAAEVFMHEEDLEECARAIFLFLAAPGSVLMRGTDPVLNPSKVIEAPVEIRERLMPIYLFDESETSNRWTDIRQKAAEAWEEAVKEFDLVSVGEGYHPTENWSATVERWKSWSDERSPTGYHATVTLEPR
ncbi:MAG: hypothetical protein HOV97_05985 [Nonomuraea sp.]|nr:hypothetical protein [Nonomuraea sp.]